MMDIIYTAKAHEHIIYWATTDKKVFAKHMKMITLTARSPYDGDGNPEALKHELAGFWSRRITSEDRLVYSVQADAIRIISCKGHYSEL
jgi:toxin YoeB